MKKFNSSSLLISMSFILILSVITSIFMVSFKDISNIENKNIKEGILNFREFENYKNKIQFSLYQTKITIENFEINNPLLNEKQEFIGKFINGILETPNVLGEELKGIEFVSYYRLMKKASQEKYFNYTFYLNTNFHFLKNGYSLGECSFVNRNNILYLNIIVNWQNLCKEYFPYLPTITLIF